MVVSLIAVVVGNACASTSARVLESKTSCDPQYASAPQDKQRSASVVADAKCSVETRCILVAVQFATLER